MFFVVVNCPPTNIMCDVYQKVNMAQDVDFMATLWCSTTLITTWISLVY